ncbi:cysteine desulfurase family protein [Haliangium ochraceum]|uniref:Cysteine desulfurase n=1 Tax=Haliangium ochraceum (strain DSM 14365 / JCM 11303 / SMP-2) TaxID=502025 RepID=D0LY74_HALO1|nr:cysteine desulfurase family protein [Haliangium ochraceum]ACY16224.1 Cysteine desulfurase [Haliangium ochraceum DSM 14365]
MRIYLDHNATTPLDTGARQAMIAALDIDGNPSSVHTEGREARSLVESARRQVASLLAGAPEDIIFTSGGTEANVLGLVGLARSTRAAGARARVLLSALEHPAVSGSARSLADEGFEIVWLPVDASGRVRADALAALAREGASACAVALANHEIGTVQDVAAIAAQCAAHGVPVHCDAVQAAGKMALDAAALGVSTLAISAHKFYGPKGVGALWVRAGLSLPPLFSSGHQERERRPGTENLAGVAGMGAAAALACTHQAAWATQIRAHAAALERGLRALDQRIGGIRIHGEDVPRIGNTVNAGFTGALGESLVVALDLAGFAVSAGAACTSGSVEPSAVLLAIGQPAERAVEAVRFSLGRDNTAADIEALLEVLPGIVSRARKFR